MSFGKDSFVEFRKKVLEERKNRLLDSTNSNISTVAQIATTLEKSSMIAGINYLRFLLTIVLVGRGRSVAMLSDPNAKNRKLNEISNENAMEEDLKKKI